MKLSEIRDKNRPEGIQLENAPYIVTEDGTLWSLRKQKYLKPADNGLGYLQTLITFNDNTRKMLKIHRLVAQCYIPNPENKSDVNHKDGNKANNHVNNLEWVTHKENIQHSFRVLNRKVKPIYGADHWNYGKTTKESTKSLMSASKIGENHPKFKGYYSIDNFKSPSLNRLAELIGTYPVKAHRMYKSGLISFTPKSLNISN